MSEKEKPASETSDTRDDALSAAARRALEEAAERRAQASRADLETDKPRELGGRDGPDPTRYGDWEKKGLISDF